MNLSTVLNLSRKQKFNFFSMYYSLTKTVKKMNALSIKQFRIKLQIPIFMAKHIALLQPKYALGIVFGSQDNLSCL